MTRIGLLVLSLITLAGGCVAGADHAVPSSVAPDGSVTPDGAGPDGPAAATHVCPIAFTPPASPTRTGTPEPSSASVAVASPGRAPTVPAAIAPRNPVPSANAPAPGAPAPSPDASAPSAVTEAPLADAPASPEALVVWGTDDAGTARSYFVARDDTGRLQIRERRGAIVAFDGTLWRWHVHEQRVPLYLDCDRMDDGDTTVSTSRRVAYGTAARGELLRMGAPGRRVVNRLAPDARAEAAYEAEVMLIGSVGPYLFVHDAYSDYDCGAHGNGTHSFRTWDAAHRRAVDLYARDELEAIDHTLWPRARTALLARYPGALDAVFDGKGLRDRDMERTLIAPVFAADGGASMEHQVTADADYVDSDDAWGSYTVSTRVRTDILPARLRPVLSGTAPLLRAFAAVHPKLHIAGVGTTLLALRTVFEQAR